MVRWRSGERGHGVVTRTLHWSVAVLFVVQAVVGLTMDADDGGGRGRGRGRSGESGRGRGRGGQSDGYDPFGDDAFLTVHVLLGVTVLVLVLVRLLWRVTTPMAPWAPMLSRRERALVQFNERAMYVLMIAVPASGLLLVTSGDDDLLPLHVGSQLALLVAVGVHLTVVARHQLVRRDGYVRRMV
jgi:cytochrome b561